MAQHRMVSLRRKPSKTDSVEAPTKSLFPVTLFINDPELSKLGLEDFEVGEIHELRAIVKVESVSMHEGSGGKDRSITLALTDAEVNSAHSEADKAKKLFGE